MGIMPEIWEIVDGFKKRCQLKGWHTIEHEDVVESNGEYHSLKWIRGLHPSTFNRVAGNVTYKLKLGEVDRIVNVSYTAWICNKTSCEALMQIMVKNPELLTRNAVFNLSQAYTNNMCLKINETASEVFQDFERFLENKLKIAIKSAGQI